MSDPRKRPCCICRHWFRPDPRLGARQRACDKAECRAALRQKSQASWRRRNRGYAIAYRIDQRAGQAEPPEVLRVPAPLDQLPWEFAKDEFGSQQADFMGVLGALMVRTAKDEFRAYLIDPTRVPGTLPRLSRKTRSEMGHSEPAGDDASGVSPTRAALGTSACPPSAAAAATDGVVGRIGPTDADRGGAQCRGARALVPYRTLHSAVVSAM
jgi:hypothetical protein